MKAIIPLCAIAILLVGCGDAIDTVYSEARPREINRKYEWFKDAHARLTALQSQVRTKEAQMVILDKAYEGVKRQDWSRIDIQNQMLYSQELAGMKASFDNLAAEYNAEMAKWHTAFANFGTSPTGGTLPKEFIPYNAN
jgi:hypothetical protein